MQEKPLALNGKLGIELKEDSKWVEITESQWDCTDIKPASEEWYECSEEACCDNAACGAGSGEAWCSEEASCGDTTADHHLNDEWYGDHEEPGKSPSFCTEEECTLGCIAGQAEAEILDIVTPTLFLLAKTCLFVLRLLSVVLRMMKENVCPCTIKLINHVMLSIYYAGMNLAFAGREIYREIIKRWSYFLLLLALSHEVKELSHKVWELWRKLWPPARPKSESQMIGHKMKKLALLALLVVALRKAKLMPTLGLQNGAQEIENRCKIHN